MHGYYPMDPQRAWEVDSNLDANVDLQEKFWHMKFAKDQQQQELLDEYKNKVLPSYFNVMEKRLQNNGSQRYIVGDTLTIADFDNVHIAYDYFYNPNNPYHKEHMEVLSQYKLMQKYYEGLRENDMKDHFENKTWRPDGKAF